MNDQDDMDPPGRFNDGLCVGYIVAAMIFALGFLARCVMGWVFKGW